MRLSSKVLVLLLLGAVASISLAGHILPLSIVPHERPAGCHEHGQQAPVPEPVSYKCCQAGHHSAILQESSTSRPVLLHLLRVADFAEPFTNVCSLRTFRHLLISSSDPPSNTPLRI